MFISSEQNELLKDGFFFLSGGKKKELLPPARKRKHTQYFSRPVPTKPPQPCSVPSRCVSRVWYWPRMDWLPSVVTEQWHWKCGFQTSSSRGSSIPREIAWNAVSQSRPQTYQLRNSKEQFLSARPLSDSMHICSHGRSTALYKGSGGLLPLVHNSKGHVSPSAFQMAFVMGWIVAPKIYILES